MQGNFGFSFPHLVASVALPTAALCAAIPVSASVAEDAPEAVVIHPPFSERYTCSEHFLGELPYVGDALGTDCTIQRSGRSYRTDGSTNEDYYVWRQPVLAPFDGIVERVRINSETNTPGVRGKPPATSVKFRSDDGLSVLVGHLDDISVVEGERVSAGQPFAVVGNNGMSTSPHIHIGAWQEATPYQVRFDLAAMGRVRKPQ